MILVLCHDHDHSAIEIAGLMRRITAQSVKIVTPEQIIYSNDFAQRVSTDTVASSVSLLSGQVLSYERISGALNRICEVPTAHLKSTVASDHDYIVNELHAILTSWIYGLQSPVINRSTAISLMGPTYHPAVWQHLATRCGLPVYDVKHSQDNALPFMTSQYKCIVLRGRVFGNSELVSYQQELTELSSISGLDLFEAEFSQSDNGLALARVHTFPNLSTGGQCLAAAMVTELGGN